MATLYIDTALSPLFMAVVKGEQQAVYAGDNVRASDGLHDILPGLLADVGATAPEISRVVMVRGPGSFTGIRVAYCVAEALKLARPEVEILGVESLPALLFSQDLDIDVGQKVLLLSNAYGGQVFAQGFTCMGAGAWAVDAPAVSCMALDVGALAAERRVLRTADVLLADDVVNTIATAITLAGLQQALAVQADAADYSPQYVKPLTYRTVAQG